MQEDKLKELESAIAEMISDKDRKRLVNDMLFYGICCYKTNEDGKIEYIDPISEEGLRAREEQDKK